MSLLLVLGGAFLCAAGGVPGLFLRRAETGRRLAVAGSVVGALLGLAGAALAAATGTVETIHRAWPLPSAAFHVSLDALSALFLAPLFLVSGVAAVSGARSFGDEEHPDDAPRTRFFFGLATGAIALVLLARNLVFFLASWEVMALSAFFLVTADRSSREARDAGRLYLFATHVSTLVLFGFFALFRSLSGSTELVPLPAGVAGSDAGTVLFVLALVGFGLKAGLLPLHVWLPPAHAAAPAHVSALMSGVLIKTGIYGIVRFTSLVPDPPASWGDTLLLLGAASAVLGVAFALGQHDLKRLLAWHSVENIGIIVLGLGVGLGARAAGRPEWVLLGFAGGLFHVVNHGLFKPLLFLGAGEAAHVAGTRDMDRMGGLGKLLPKTALLFAAGAVAISGLPPLNGFASEWLVYLGLFDRARATGPDALRAAFGVPALALTGALALACFVKAHGAVFLGSPRAEAPQLHGQPASHGEPSAHVGPMAVLAVACALLGLLPAAIAPALARAAAIAAPGPVPPTPLAEIASLRTVGVAALAVVLLVGAVALLLRRRLAAETAAGPTWDCGYARPTARMQYTASSFARGPVGWFGWALRPRLKGAPVAKLFPAAAQFESHVLDTVLDRAVVPVFRAGAWLARQGRVLQHGKMQLYLVYVVATLVALLFKV
ncbi:MAG: proton-conducting transporter transmembrane domain-containing protein [Thermoanaerobaculia bacterium]